MRRRSRTIQVAGLLHDIGKIGIPDAVLRKPRKLTGDEYQVVKQHVALGDLIVRDVPNVELIRAGDPPPPRAVGRTTAISMRSRARHPARRPASSRSATPSRR